jgi:hypothetical protein
VLPITVGAQVSITAFGGSPVADSAVPLLTCFIRPVIKSSNLFLFNSGATVSSAIVLEVTSLKVSEMAEFRQLNMFGFPSVLVDGSVEVNDFEMGKWKGSEKLKYVFGVLLQLLGSMRERAEFGGSSGVPSDGPVSVGLDGFGWFSTAN